MVLVFILGLLDLTSAVVLFLLKFFPALKLPALVLAGLLLLKSIVYFFDISSIFDIVSVFIFIAAIFGYYPLFTYAVIFWLLQKGIRSFV
ncbi:hypothetical protein D6777_04070 [Candidatus Woesearchaeota archaeon]|nr:MAG: hypothetical protein D6777_04070 [Candidatus Woesearchaeota archaeon]